MSPTILSSSSFHGLVVWGYGLWTDRVFSLSPGLAQRTPDNDDNNNNNIELLAFMHGNCSSDSLGGMARISWTS